MKYKKIKYNLIVIILIAIIGCSIIVPLSNAGISQENQGSVEDLFPEDVVVPEVEEEDTEDPSYEEDKFLYTNAWDLVNYSVDKLYSGAGYNSVFSQIMNIEVSVLGSTIRASQNVKGDIVRNGTSALERRFFYSSYEGSFSNLIRNNFSSFYIDRQAGTIEHYDVEDCNADDLTFDAVNGLREKFSYEEGINLWGSFYGDTFPMKTNKSTVFSTKELDVQEDDKLGKYRTIVIKYENDKIPSGVYGAYLSSGEITDINFISYTLTYKINVNTGKMISVSRDEISTGLNPAFNVKVKNTVRTNQVFLSVDKEQQIVMPV